MPFPTTGVLDNFNRANEGPPPSASWTSDTGTGPNNLVVNTNVCAATAGNAFAYWNPSTFGPDSEGYFTLTTKAGNGAYIAVYLRYDAAGNNGYEGEYDEAATDTSAYWREDAGAYTQLGASVSQEFVVGDGFGLEMIGSTMQLYRRSSGVWAALGTTRTDATYTAAGNIGMQMSHTTNRFDDFGGGTVASDTLYAQSIM